MPDCLDQLSGLAALEIWIAHIAGSKEDVLATSSRVAPQEITLLSQQMIWDRSFFICPRSS